MSKKTQKKKIKKISKLSKLTPKKKMLFGGITFITLGIILVLLACLSPNDNFIKGTGQRFLESNRIFTREVPNVEIDSSDYDDPGSWHIDKSAKWTGNKKAQIKFDLKTKQKEPGANYHDIILVLDVSESMSVDKLNKVKQDSKELVEELLSNQNNKVALISFETSSQIELGFTNNKQTVLDKIDSLSISGRTNYNAAYKNVLEVMENYQKQTNRDLVMLFLTDGYPNEDTPNQIGTYEIIKEQYPYMTINGVQYEMGSDVVDEIKEVTDNQWVADISSLNNVLFEAAIDSKLYDNFVIEDYIDDEYFYVDSVDDIKPSRGTVTLTEESGKQKITWTLDSGFKTGNRANLLINVKLKDEDFGSIEYFSTNLSEKITSKIEDEQSKNETFDDTPVLKSSYNVDYDTNTPAGCTLSPISQESHTPYSAVTKHNEIACSGYNFKGWKIITEGVTSVNSNVFIMPDKDVTLRAVWTKQDIVKSMDGTVKEDNLFASVIKKQCSEEGYTEGNGNGVYATNSYTEDGETKYHDCRYVGANPNNYVKFNDDMYQVIGVFDDYSHGVTGEELVKIISTDLMTATSYGAYNTGDNTGTYSGYSNNWTGTGQTSPSNSFLLLNEYFLNRTKTSGAYGDCSNWTYYYYISNFKTKSCDTLVGYGIKSTYRNYIEDAKWYLYGYSSNSLSKQNFYECERGNYSGCTSGNSGAYDTEKTSKIGMMYPSDYLYASGYVASSATTPGSSNYFGNSNWLYKGYEWTISPRRNSTDYAVSVWNLGSLYDSYTTSYGSGLRPVLYLKSTVYVTGGTGTFDDPYEIDN